MIIFKPVVTRLREYIYALENLQHWYKNIRVYTWGHGDWIISIARGEKISSAERKVIQLQTEIYEDVDPEEYPEEEMP